MERSSKTKRERRIVDGTIILDKYIIKLDILTCGPDFAKNPFINKCCIWARSSVSFSNQNNLKKY